MKTIQIERRKAISQAEFRRDYLNGSGRPVIISDATAHWPARTKWTFEFFKSMYGSDLVPVGFDGTGSGYGIAKLTTLASFLNVLDAPESELPGFWVSQRDLKPLRETPPTPPCPPYLMTWSAFKKHPELYEDIKPHPAYMDDWVTSLDPTIRDLFDSVSGREFWTIYIGPRNTLSKLHQDYWRTHSCLTQIQGRKRVVLFSPEDSGFLYEGQVDPEQPDFERFELFREATRYEGLLEPGETLFTPSKWWHHIRSLDKSITLSHNYFNEVNVNHFLVGLLRRLPELAHLIEQSEQLQKAMDIKWNSPSFGFKSGES